MKPPQLVIEQLRSFELSLLDPLTRRSRATVSELLADDFFEFGTSGIAYDRAAVLEGMANEVPSKVTMSAFEVYSLSRDVCLATFATSRYDQSGELVSKSLRSSIWRLSNGRWRLTFHQGTRIPSA